MTPQQFFSLWFLPLDLALNGSGFWRPKAAPKPIAAE